MSKKYYSFMRYIFVLIFLSVCGFVNGQVTATDGNWLAISEFGSTPEADIMIRVGDINNLGFGWDAGFDPFTGESTRPHSYPWEPKPNAVPGLDRILLGSSFGRKDVPCGGDGYSGMGRAGTMPQAIKIPLRWYKDKLVVKSATLTLFVDDFQAPPLCSKFQAALNGQRFNDLELVLNELNQTGPIGKLISVRLPDELLYLLQQDQLSLLIDDPTTGAADGYAIDFVKLLINPKALINKGTVRGRVISKEDGQPIYGSSVQVTGYGQVKTDVQGNFYLTDLPAGLNVVIASANSYASGREVFDVIANQESGSKDILLERSKVLNFNGQKMKEGDTFIMKSVQFAQGSSVLTEAGEKELDNLVTFMRSNSKVEIELSGHTSNEGSTQLNTQLSLDRTKSCKKYLIGNSVDEGRISAKGYGPDRPLVPNTSESNRSINRRVELRLLRIQ